MAALDAGDEFTFGGKTYTQSAVGLINDSTISEELKGKTLKINKLSTTSWDKYLAPSGNVLNLTDATEDALILDNTDNPTEKLATLKVVNDRKTLTGEAGATAIEAVTLGKNSVLDVDFVTQVFAPQGSVKVNSETYNATTEVIIDSDGTTSTLNDGTVILDSTNSSVTASDSSTLSVEDDTINVTAVDGKFSTVDDLQVEESFKLDDKIYTQSAVGLMTDGKINEKLVGEKIDISGLTDADWSDVVVPDGDTLDLTSVTNNSLICDDEDNPTKKYAALTVDDGKMTLKNRENAADTIKTVEVAADTNLKIDFVAQINAPIGSVTVNNKSYDGTTELVIDSDGKTSTLTQGTVSLAKGKSVTTTTGNKITARDGDGMTVTADGTTVTVGGLNVGDTFKVDDDTYKISPSGLINTNGKFWTGKADYADGLTVAALEDAANWTGFIVAKDGALSVDASTIADGENVLIVDDADNPTKIFGTLTKNDDGEYSLTKDADNTLESIAIDGVKITIDNDLADVPITVNNADGTKTLFEVTPSQKTDNFIVDATSDMPTADGMKAIEISTGKIELLDGQTITLADDAAEVEVWGGNGNYNVGDENFTIANLADDDKIKFTFGTDGNVDSIVGLDKDSTVTIDGKTYSAPEDSAILHYTEEDGWYFDGFAYDDYNVTVDENGNIIVEPGVKLSNVISSGKTITSDNSIQFAANISETPVTVTNKDATAISIKDSAGSTLAENFGKSKVATFTGDGVEAETLSDISGTTFNLQVTQTVKAGDTTITANANDTQVGIGTDANSLSLDKGAKIDAPADIDLTLNAGEYEVNGVEFTGEDTTSATTTTDGVKLDLAKSGSFAYDNMTLQSGAGTAEIDNSGGVTLEGGAAVTDATGKAFTVNDKAYLDDKTINTATATQVTATSSGVNVGNRTLAVDGDTDGYTVNISGNDISGLENIGASGGVTVGGLNNATIKTDKLGSMTVGNKTYLPDNASITYGLSSGRIASISGIETVVGDFTERITVNGVKIQLVGDSEVSVVGDKKSVTKILMDEEGTFKVSGKTYQIDGDNSFAFAMSGGAVSGIESLENGTLTISQKEDGLSVNSEKITLTGNSSPVTLNIADSSIYSVGSLNGTINGLENATVYGLTSAVVNNKLLDISNSDPFDAIVINGVMSSITGVTGGSTINSAPLVTITTADNGTFTFDGNEYVINDTLDASVDFITDENSHVKGIDNFAGSISGALDGVESLNGVEINITGTTATITADENNNITSIEGIADGTAINGAVADLHYVLPEGEVTVNGITYNLTGDDDGALFVSNDGRALDGLDKDATLSVSEAGTYTINGVALTAQAGDAFTVNRDGVYIIDPDKPPISEKTKAEDILNRSENSQSVTGAAEVELTGDELLLVEGGTASVKAGEGSDTVVVRHDADVKVDLNENGETLIIPTAGKVTLENYDGDNASVQTFEYSNVIGAVKSNEIKFGDGTMTLGDAIITFDENATDDGYTGAKIINAHGQEQPVAFTHKNGGIIDVSDSNDYYLLKGNYAENPSDTQKSGGSTILAGTGNDTILAGAGDSVNGGGGSNQIYLTDKTLRNTVPEGATIVMSDNNYDTVHNFAAGFDHDDDKIFIKDLDELTFGYGAGDLVMSSDKGRITFDNIEGDGAYELKLTDGTNDYNAAVAKDGEVMNVGNDSEADVFFGNKEGISFSEYTGTLEVNLNDATGDLTGRNVKFYGVDKVEAGAGDTSLIGAAGKPNTLIGGTGNSSIWSNSGRDLMVGNTDDNKSGYTTFFYLPGDGRDTIENFDFMSSATDINADYVKVDDFSGVTDVFLDGDNVVIGINNSADDYLTLVDAKGKSFRFNDDLIAKVDNNVAYDGFTNCYVGTGNNPTLTIGEGMGDVAIWLSDDDLSYHGIRYDGNFARLDASASDGNNTLAGNQFNNLILGGAGANSMWGGYASSDDTLVGGSGQNTFFFALENGHDVIQNAHDGDLVSLEDIYYDNIARADITDGGAFIELNDGSTLEIQSTANLDYRLQDGTTYTADRTNREWVQK